MSQIVVNLLCRSEVMPIGQNLLDRGSLPSPALTARRLGRSPLSSLGLVVISSAPRRRRPGGSVLIVMIRMGCMPMTFMDEIGVIAMLHCLDARSQVRGGAGGSR